MTDDSKIWVAIIAGGLGVIGAIITAIMNYLFKAKTDKQLASLNDKLQTQRAHLDASLRKKERFEVTRSSGYEDIWNLTGSLNLFGPTNDLDIKDLSTRLKNWYFKNGLVLRNKSKKRYFLVQEILNFGMLRSASFTRPADERLFGNPKRTTQVLRDLRLRYLGITDHSGKVKKNGRICEHLEGGLQKAKEES